MSDWARSLSNLTLKVTRPFRSSPPTRSPARSSPRDFQNLTRPDRRGPLPGTPRARASRQQGRPLLDKGKPAVRRGRKATGQARRLTAGLPKEGRSRLPENIGVFRTAEGHGVFRRSLAGQSHLPGASLPVARRPPPPVAHPQRRRG